MIYLSDIIKTEVIPAMGISALRFHYGYAEELNKTLNQMENNKQSFIWLVQPFTFEVDGKILAGTAKDVRFVIFGASDQDYTTSTRIEKVFKPLIDPLYDSFMNALKNCAWFEKTGFEHEVTDFSYWNDNQLDDVMDLRNITKLNLKIRKNICKL